MNLRSPRIAVALLGALVAVSCSAEPEPRVAAPSATATASLSVTPTVAPVVEAESPDQFVRRFFDVSARMQNTGETEDYRALTSDCIPCTELADTVERYYGDGGYIEFGGSTVASPRAAVSNPGTVAIRVDVTSQPTTYRPSSTEPETILDGGINVIEVVLVGPSDRGWLVTDFGGIGQ